MIACRLGVGQAGIGPAHDAEFLGIAPRDFPRPSRGGITGCIPVLSRRTGSGRIHRHAAHESRNFDRGPGPSRADKTVTALRGTTHLTVLPGELAQLAVFRLCLLVYLPPPAVHSLVVEELLAAALQRLALSTEALLNERIGNMELLLLYLFVVD